MHFKKVTFSSFNIGHIPYSFHMSDRYSKWPITTWERRTEKQLQTDTKKLNFRENESTLITLKLVVRTENEKEHGALCSEYKWSKWKGIFGQSKSKSWLELLLCCRDRLDSIHFLSSTPDKTMQLQTWSKIPVIIRGGCSKWQTARNQVSVLNVDF